MRQLVLHKGFFDVLRTKYDLEHSQEPELLFCSDRSVYRQMNTQEIQLHQVLVGL